jgi:hypothetical protein
MDKIIRKFNRQHHSKTPTARCTMTTHSHQYSGVLRLFLFTLVIFTASAIASTVAIAQPAEVQTPSPVIFLSDNLGEPDNLGWCIDTVGRGFAENLHAHTCKPRGGDVQFTYRPSDQSIASVTFDNKCIVRNTDEAIVSFSLADCDPSISAQQFLHDPSNGYLSPANDEDLCMAVGDSIRKAGPFSSRDLLLLECAATDTIKMTWTVRN